MSLGDKLATRLRELRGPRTQDWLAKSIGASRATINRWETKGAGSATINDLELLTEIFDTSVEDLLGLSRGHEIPQGARRELLLTITLKNGQDVSAADFHRALIDHFKAQGAIVEPSPRNALIKEEPRVSHHDLGHRILESFSDDELRAFIDENRDRLDRVKRGSSDAG